MERENARFERADIEGLRLSPEHRDALEGGPVRVYATGIRWYPEDAGLVEEWMSEAMRSSSSGPKGGSEKKGRKTGG